MFPGNPWPPVVPHVRNIRGSLLNVLLEEARKERQQKQSIALEECASDVAALVHTDVAAAVHTDVAAALHTDVAAAVHTDVAAVVHTDVSTSTSQSSYIDKTLL